MLFKGKFMSKIKQLFIIVFLSCSSIVYTNEQTEKTSGTTQDTQEIETDQVNDLFENNEDQVPAPRFENPSKITIFIRHYGIALLHKYYAVKNWIYAKLNLNNKIN